MKYLEDVSTLKLDPALCTGCGKCSEACPRRVLEPRSGKIAIRDLDACIECGACARNCPANALTVQAGTGCAYAILNGMLRGTAPTCGCQGD